MRRYVYLGEMSLEGYDLVIITDSQNQAEQALLREWKEKAKKRGTDAPFSIADATFELLQYHLECSVRQIPMNLVVWP